MFLGLRVMWAVHFLQCSLCPLSLECVASHWINSFLVQHFLYWTSIFRMVGHTYNSFTAHNVACSLVMLSICIYVLNRVPDMVHGMRTAFRQMKAIFVVRGLAGGENMIHFSIFPVFSVWLPPFLIVKECHCSPQHYIWARISVVFHSTIDHSTFSYVLSGFISFPCSHFLVKSTYMGSCLSFFFKTTSHCFRSLLLTK